MVKSERGRESEERECVGERVFLCSLGSVSKVIQIDKWLPTKNRRLLDRRFFVGNLCATEV